MNGSIMFFIIERRSDIAFATLVASRFVKNANHQYIEAVKTILCYLKAPKEQTIT